MVERGGALAGTVLDGRYQVGPVLARGGMSTVYRGTDTRLDRPVAIKVMDPRFTGDPVFVHRFEREARAAARLHHPGVVGVYDQGIDRSPDGDHVFLVMELVDGGTLRDLLHERGALPVPLALSVAGQVLSALAAAHREGLVHRDVKPENVLIGPGGAVKVADFGLVRAAAEASTSTGDVILGTVAYLSPEQVATGAADARSDVYAAGIVLFEMLTGHPPYTGDTALSVAYRHVNDDVPEPGALAPGGTVPRRLDELVVRATRRDPLERPADASAFLLELQRVRSEEGIPRVPVPVPTGVPDTEPIGAGGRGTRSMTRTDMPEGAPGPPWGTPLPPDRARSDGEDLHRQRIRGRRAFITWVLVILLLAGAIGTAAWWLGTGRWTSVPDVVGLDRAAVETALDRASLGAEITSDHHDTVPPGLAIGSDPETGARAVRGSDVAVVLSLGRPVVPDLPGGTRVDEAEQIVTEADLRPIRDAAAVEFSDTVPEGAVIGLRPAPGTVLTVGAPVSLVISRGPAPIDVPDVRGLSEADATAALSDAGLTVARVQRRFDSGVDGGNAIGTEPGAGEATTRGTDVTLLVSTALVVPDVVGTAREDALATLADAGFAPRETGEGAGTAGASVSSIDPRPGSRVDPSDNRITVEMTTDITVPDVVGLPLSEARSVLADAGLQASAQQFFGNESSRVLAQFPGAGATIRLGGTVRVLTT